MATGRTRRNYGVGRELTGEELSRRKTEIARLERWTGRAKKTSVRRTPARHCACSALLDFLHGLETPPRHNKKNFGVWGVHVKSSRPYVQLRRMRGPPKKTSPVKKEWQVGQDNDSRLRRPHGGARACTGADGAVVLNLRRGPEATALLSRTDGQLTRAGQHYYSHLGLRPPSKDFDYNQPLIRGATTSCCATGRRSLCAPCRAESTG